MFGYIAPRLDHLTEEQRVRYRSVYCGLCHEIGKQSGQEGRLLLSHDMTFLALLLQSLMDDPESTQTMRCPMHPVHKREFCHSKSIEYAASMNLILMDFKCQDQIRDAHSRLGMAEHKKLQPAIETVKTAWPEQYRSVKEALSALWEEEQKDDPNPDHMCNLSGEMLKTVFVPSWVDSCWKPVLEGIGRELGRFVYWMDAWDDLEKDLRKNQINPLTKWKDTDELDAFVRAVLEMFLGKAVDCFEMLPLEKDLGIMRNILYSGVWQRFDAKAQIYQKKRRKQL